MLTAERWSDDTIVIRNEGRASVAAIYGTHDLKKGELFPVKSLYIEGDKIRVEVERPLSLVEAVGKCHGFGKHTQPHPKWSKGMLAVYEAWKREKEQKGGE